MGNAIEPQTPRREGNDHAKSDLRGYTNISEGWPIKTIQDETR
jgi:hypothetical protein